VGSQARLRGRQGGKPLVENALQLQKKKGAASAQSTQKRRWPSGKERERWFHNMENRNSTKDTLRENPKLRLPIPQENRLFRFTRGGGGRNPRGRRRKEIFIKASGKKGSPVVEKKSNRNRPG